MERVLRNRRAAQSSRERKRQEVEALEAEKRQIERRNQDLEMRLADMEARNLMLQQELEQITGNMAGGKMTVFRSASVASSPGQIEQFRQTPTPVTFSQELFSSRDADQSSSISHQSTVDVRQSSVRTVNPASISPELKPVVETTSNASSSDMTQHPAAMLCDLQCQSEEQRPWMNSMTITTTTTISQILAATLFINMLSEVFSTFLSPLNQIVSSLNTGSSLSPTPSILTMIIWLATTTASLTTSTSAISSTTTTSHSLRPKFSLRIRLLRRLLACSPNLARPLLDATMVAMRRASEQQLTRDYLNDVDLCDRLDVENSPTVESLMTLLWAISVIDKEGQHEEPELDAATELREACRELDKLFRARDMNRKRVSLVSGRGGTIGQKWLEEWRAEF